VRLLSFVIPIYNGAATITEVVDEIHRVFAGRPIEIVLVNDGSSDNSETVCRELQAAHPGTVTFVHLARNFGEHGATLAGLRHATGAAVAILDDDGQNPPAEVERLVTTLVDERYDVVYGRYRVKQHSFLRNLGSRFNDRMANWMLKKPRDLYLSSFKVLERFLVDEITRYEGAFPYIDGLILRSTGNIGQIDVEHRQRKHGRSGYTAAKLASLWLNMFLNFSIAPLRLSALLGVVMSGFSLLLLVGIIIDKLYINPELTHGLPTVLALIVFFAGLQLVLLGAIGEYLGRLFLDQSKKPQCVVRYVHRRTPH
jgi:undecaprenyl-phosphate 4-deoxy-4-formamido-L-arabinose transferase